MKTATKAALLCICATMLTLSTVFGTLAYFTSTAEVTNTFTVGNVMITMDEAKVNLYGVPVDVKDDPVGKVGDAPRSHKNEYKLLPGHTYTKDPTIHVAANSEDCWLFVRIEDGIQDLQGSETVAVQLKENGWKILPTETDTNAIVYAYKEIVTGGNDITVFENFKIKDDVEYETLREYAKEKQIVITAYAVQADGFKDAADAWNATFGETNPVPQP